MNFRIAFFALVTFAWRLHGQADVDFFQPNLVPLNCNPGLLAQGDFNHDGITDLVVPCGALNSFLVLLADGRGGFGSPVSYAIASPIAIAVGDLNGDGNPDLVVAGSSQDLPSLSVFFGKGNGTFPDSVTIGAASTPTYVAIADTNGDGNADIVFGTEDRSGHSALHVLLGNGDGTFQPAKISDLQEPPMFFMTGDFNGDGKVDLAIVENFNGFDENTRTVVCFGNGDGTFQAETKTPIKGYSGTGFLVTGDFNHDGRTDIAGLIYNNVQVGFDSTLSIALGQADGTFTTAATYKVEDNAQTVATADLNNDGVLDLAVANNSSGTVTVLLGNGDGTFSQERSYPAATFPYSIAIGNFAANGGFAIAVNSDAAPPLSQVVLSLLPVQSGGTLTAPPLRPIFGATTYGILPADYNGDGKLDLLSTKGPELLFLAGNGDGSFQPAIHAAEGPPEVSPAFAGDFNNDGILDVFTLNMPGGAHTGWVYLGNGDGTFRLPQGTVPLGPFVAQLFGDVNNDGILDVVVTSFGNLVTVYLGKGDGTFQSGIALPYPNISPEVLGDFNNDGKLDIITYASENNPPMLLLGNGDGTFQPPVPTSPNGASFAVDLNHDGNLDLINIVSPALNATSLSIALGNGNGTFQTPQLYTTPSGNVGFQPYIADFNGDGILDIAVPEYFFLGLGDGTFSLQNTPFDFGPNGIRAVSDFFNHGLPDIQTSFGSENSILILKNRSVN